MAIGDRRASEADLESRVPGLDPTLLDAELNAEEPAFVTRSGDFGVLDVKRLRAWATWEARFGIVRRRPDLAKAFDAQFLSGTGSPVGG